MACCPRCGGDFGEEASFCPTDGTPLDPEVGRTIAGDIVLTSVAGVGATGRVYRAYQHGIGRVVAVKVLHRELSRSREMVERFEREAKIASKLRHPNVVEIYLAGRLDDGLVYIVMEYLDGVSLRTALDEAGGAFDAMRAVSIALQICDACAEAHANGVVHRDLKPENVALVRRHDAHDFVKVLDFGIAKTSLGGTMASAAGAVFGTARYISPEGARGATVSPASDVYSIATVLYEMLAGRTPFDADDGLALLVKHVHEAPPDLRDVAAARGVPDALAQLVMENLAKESSGRCPDARAFGAALERVLRGAETRVAPVVCGSDPTLVDTGTPTPIPMAISLPPVELTPRRSALTRLVVAIAFVLGAAAAVAGLVVRHHAAAQHAAVIERARAALASGRIVGPRGDDVSDIVAAGLTRWPGDSTLLEIRADASRRLVTRAMVAHAGGDVEGARDAAVKALLLDPSDRSAKTLVDRYESELAVLEADAGRASGPPRVLLHVDKGVVTGRVLTGAAGNAASIARPRVTLYKARDDAMSGAPLALAETSRGAFEAHLAGAAPGRLRVVFEATVDGRPLHAERSVVVD